MSRLPYDIIFEDDNVIVCHKMPGLATESKRVSEKDLVSYLKAYRARKKENPYIGLIHRLDQPVEGLIVVGKTKEATATISKEFMEKGTVKEYLAIVKGDDIRDRGELKDYLLRDGMTNTSSVVDKDVKDAKLAMLNYEVIERFNNLALIKVTLNTGRHHQIRVQLAHAGYPIIGDRKYGDDETIEGYMPLALCSYHLCFTHPLSGKRMEYRIQPTGKAFKDCDFSVPLP